MDGNQITFKRGICESLVQKIKSELKAAINNLSDDEFMARSWSINNIISDKYSDWAMTIYESAEVLEYESVCPVNEWIMGKLRHDFAAADVQEVKYRLVEVIYWK